MSFDCDDSSRIVSKARQGGLDTLGNDALDLIKKHLFSDAQRVNSTEETSLTLTQPSGQYTLLPSEWIFEIPKIDLDKVIHQDSLLVRGCYIKEQGRIYLNRDSWCIKTLIHEILHSCSVTSVTNDLRRYQSLYEGLTEFYAGYIMSKAFQNSYQNCWRTKIMRKCQLTYEQQTKVWAAFHNFIPISETVPIYFYQNRTDWDKLFSEFTQRIQYLGFPKFQNIFTVGGPATYLKLQAQCSKLFGKKFSEICNNRDQYTDFSGILHKT
jgi:hypothetical protein